MVDSNVIRKLPYRETGRVFVIGDLHGRLDLLQKEMKAVDFDEQTDRIVAVGDLIDRGDQSRECLELLFEPYFFSVMGNHEELMIRSVLSMDMACFQCWMANGGLWAIDYTLNNNTWKEDFVELVDTIKELLPLAYEIETKDGSMLGIVHAEPPLEWSTAAIERGRLGVLWSRSLYDSKEHRQIDGIEGVYVGHTPVGAVETRGNITYTDTGAQWTGNLTMLQIV